MSDIITLDECYYETDAEGHTGLTDAGCAEAERLGYRVDVDAYGCAYAVDDQLTAVHSRDGWRVEDERDRWWPGESAAAEISASLDPATTARRICATEPHRGEWHD